MKTLIKNLPTYISLAAFFVAVLSLWITFLNFYYARVYKGSIELTQPSAINFVPGDGKFVASTIVVTAMLYSTADGGNYVEGMSVGLEREEGTQYFSRCQYEDHGTLRPGAFFVDKTGISTNFHFWSPGYGEWYPFLPGEYTLRIYVKCPHQQELKVKEIHLSVSLEVYREMQRKKKGVCFVWSNSLGQYVAHVGSGEKSYLRQLKLAE